MLQANRTEGSNPSLTATATAGGSDKSPTKRPPAYPYKKIRNESTLRDQHRLVMEAHLGRKLERHEAVHHKNGNGFDNRIENLEVLTIAEHSRLHRRNGDTGVISEAGKQRLRQMYQGEKSLNAKLKAADIPEILKWRKLGASYASIADRLGVGSSAIRDVVGGYTWTHVTGLQRRMR